MAALRAKEGQPGFHWLRWTVIGCAAWLVFMAVTGAGFAAIFLMPVVGPLAGWLVGGALYLLTGLGRSR